VFVPPERVADSPEHYVADAYCIAFAMHTYYFLWWKISISNPQNQHLSDWTPKTNKVKIPSKVILANNSSV
jgi:hypothetical protein